MTVPAGLPIEIVGLSKTFGAVQAVQDLSFTVSPGRVTGFLGPNGSGKSTTLRMLLGLVQPSAGSATIGGIRYRDLPDPGRVVGAALEASAHPARTGRGHLSTLAPLVGASAERVNDLLRMVGLPDAADRPVGGYSLGMKQRLALAGALLGDPQVMVLDEPINGLDPAGIAWLRGFLRHLAGEGRTVLLSSHLLGEVQASVDDVVVIAEGRLVHASTLSDLVAMAGSHVRVVGPRLDEIERVAVGHGWACVPGPGELEVHGPSTAEVGAALFAAGLEIHELSTQGASLEETFLGMVGA